MGGARAPLDRLFRPKSVAFIGASTDPAKPTGRPLALLQKRGFSGDIWPVNPRAEAIAGLPCYPDLESLPGPPDAAMILVGPAHVEGYVRGLGEMGAGAAVILAGGYREVGGEGARLQDALAGAAGPMRLLGPNTMGLVNLVDGVILSASGALDNADSVTGNIAVVSQSGGILGSLYSRASARGAGLSHLVSTGNEADIGLNEAVDWMLDDPATDVLALYIEAVRDPEGFRAVAAKAAEKGKPLVAYKVGKSEAGARASASHTGAMAGADRFYDALFEQAGVARVTRFSDFLDVPLGLSMRRRMRGNRLAILTTTGGVGGLVADVCGAAGFEIPPPGPETVARLGEVLDSESFVPDRNPVDLTLAGVRSEVAKGALAALLEAPDYDGLVTVVGSSGVSQPDLVADPVIGNFAKTDKPLIVYVSPAAPGITRKLNAAGVPAFDAPEGCAAALSALAGDAPRPAALPASPAAAPAAPEAFAERSGPLNEHEAKRLFASFGIPCVKEAAAAGPQAAAALAREIGQGGPVVLKLLSRGLAHKSEAGGVRLGVAPEDAASACAEIAAGARAAGTGAAEGFLVQEMVRGGAEMILGFARDPQLGPAIMLGAGGTLAEVYGDTALALLPVGPGDVERMLANLKINMILRGYRGEPRLDTAALADAALAFAAMCEALGERLIEAEINPLFVLPEGRGVRAADAVAVLAD